MEGAIRLGSEEIQSGRVKKRKWRKRGAETERLKSADCLALGTG